MVIVDDKFFTGYRKTVMKPEEIIMRVRIPFTKQVNICLILLVLLGHKNTVIEREKIIFCRLANNATFLFSII